MADALKNVFDIHMIKMMALHFKRHWSEFDEAGFIHFASRDIDALELKARSEQIAKAMVEYLPDDFSKAGKIILASLRPMKHGEDLYGLTLPQMKLASSAGPFCQ